jgi:hypothetical protein
MAFIFIANRDVEAVELSYFKSKLVMLQIIIKDVVRFHYPIKRRDRASLNLSRRRISQGCDYLL